LGVVALHPPAEGLDVARVRVGGVDLPGRCRRRLKGLRGTTELPAGLVDAARPIGLIFGVGADLDAVLFFEPALGLAHSRRTRRRNRSGLLHAALFQAALGVGQPLRATFARSERLWQLVAALSSEALVLLGVDRFGVGEDLARESLVVARRALGGIGMDLGAVHGEHPGAHQTGIRAQRQDLAEEPGQRLLVALTEPRDRRVVRDLVCREDAKRDVFLAGALTAGAATAPD
jgi:hypothetical protein